MDGTSSANILVSYKGAGLWATWEPNNSGGKVRHMHCSFLPRPHKRDKSGATELAVGSAYQCCSVDGWTNGNSAKWCTRHEREPETKVDIGLCLPD